MAPASFLFSYSELVNYCFIFPVLDQVECGSTIIGGRYSSDRRLLVFGDSYADTGNLPRIIARSWSEPYGMTFPKKPTGRFSDGRVFTDFFGKSIDFFQAFFFCMLSDHCDHWFHTSLPSGRLCLTGIETS